MSEGDAAGRVRLVDHEGKTIDGAFLTTEDELWDPDRRRLTLLLDPARIKRGLRPHDELGYPLALGGVVRLVVDAGFRDASGATLVVGIDRSYQVADDERELVQVARWTLDPPRAGSIENLTVHLDRPLDHALLGRCLTVTDPDGRRVRGTIRIGAGERSWGLTPLSPWPNGSCRLVVDPVLEDLAGNSLRRVFDRDLRSENQTSDPISEVAFTPR